MKRYINPKSETDADPVADQRKGYIGGIADWACRYASNLSTRAKVAVAVGSLVLAVGANYVLNREPDTARDSQVFNLEDLKTVNNSLGGLIEAAGGDPLNPNQPTISNREARMKMMEKEDQEVREREARMKSIRDKLGELRGAFEEGGK